MKKSRRSMVIFAIIAMMLLFVTETLLAQNEKAFVNSRLDLVKLDTLDFNIIYLPADMKADFPFHITGSRAIKDAYKAAQEKRDGYMIYMLSMLEYDNVFTYGNLNPGKMLGEAFSIAIINRDSRLAIYVLSQQMRFNLFSTWLIEDIFREVEELSTQTKDTIALFEMANYLDYLGYKDPSPKRLRAIAYSFEDPIYIHQDEFEVYWADLKTCIKNSDKQNFDFYVAPVVTYQEAEYGDIYNERDYTVAELKKDLDKGAGGPGLFPGWTEPMDSVTIGKPIQHRRGDYAVYYWTLGREYNNPKREYIYKCGKSGPVSYETVYYFKKIDGRIRLYKILYEDM